MPGQPTQPTGLTYRESGVVSGVETDAFAGLLRQIQRTLRLRRGFGEAVLPLGYYANVIRLTENLGIAIGTDGVGTKILIAQEMERYDTVGIDCVAMNVNDLLCVGAEPLAMVDYIAVPTLQPALLEQLAVGLAAGAEQAGITLPGGEIAQLGGIIQGVRPDRAFELSGTAIGTVALDRILVGQDIAPGDAVIALASSGIHSNGLTLARRVFFDLAGWAVSRRVPEFGRTLGEELLEPTRIYVQVARALLAAGLAIRGFFHITGDGLFNLTRAAASAGFILDALPEPPPVFQLIQQLGHIEPAEMYRVFNMGLGLIAILPEAEVERALAIAAEQRIPAWRIGTATHDPERTIHLPALGLVGRAGVFRPAKG